MVDDKMVPEPVDDPRDAGEDQAVSVSAAEEQSGDPSAAGAEVDNSPPVSGDPAVPGDEVDALGFSPDEIVSDDEEEAEDEGDEDASPIEEFVDETEVVADDSEMKWYILKVQVNRENSICDALNRRVRIAGMESLFGDVLVPTEDVREYSKSGKQRIVKRKLYPGYIVVHMVINDDSWFLVRETPGIGDFTGAAGKPAPLSQEEIDRIIATTCPPEEEEGDEAQIKTMIKHKVGDTVRVKEGYFQNYEGEVSGIDERNGRITVMINIFGRPNPVELDHWQVEDL